LPMANFRPGHRLPGTLRRAGLVGLAALALGGCANGGASPVGETLTGLLPGGKVDAARAESLPYASLALDTGDRSGLVILGAIAGPHTYWPTGQDGMLVLFEEGLQATAGLPVDLLQSRYLPLSHPQAASSQTGAEQSGTSQGEAESAPAENAQADDERSRFVPWRQAAPAEYRVERRWQPRDGLPRELAARGSLRCDAAQPVELPPHAGALRGAAGVGRRQPHPFHPVARRRVAAPVGGADAPLAGRAAHRVAGGQGLVVAGR
ncbi:hypothetical protein, partial [Halomonas sp. BM-2019]|uniref:hypothetical protein n=1 Tax=Halomonas sp. BM-2019 TaxID=2811227 RepID=UPI001B3C4929